MPTIKRGDFFLTRKSGDLVQALGDPEPKPKGWYAVECQDRDGIARWTMIQPDHPKVDPPTDW